MYKRQVETLRSGKITTAYLLSSGDYLLAANAQLVEDGLKVRYWDERPVSYTHLGRRVLG